MPSSLPYIRPRRLPKSTFPPPANAQKVLSAVAALRECWHRIHDLDRAIAAREIVDLDVSRRRLAKELGFSEGLLRHLLKALKASPADLELARLNLIPTNEVVRRAAGHPGNLIIEDYDAPRRRFSPEVTRIAGHLAHWLRSDPARSARALPIMETARQELCAIAEAGELPLVPVRLGMPIEEAIRRCRPKRRKGESHASWYGRWAGVWTFRVGQNIDVCWEALGEALDLILIAEQSRTFGSPAA